MVKSRQFKIVQAECPLCRKTLGGLSEKQWWRGFEIHLRLSKDHAIKNAKEIDRILKTVKPSFHTIIKEKYYME